MAIPVIDLALPDAERNLIDAAENVGFFSVVGHGIDETVRRNLRAAVVELFSVSDEDKHRQAITRDNYRGFIPLGFFTPNRADASDAADRYEGFKLHWEVAANDPICAESPIYGPNRWPDHPADLPQAVAAYWAACDELAAILITMFERALGQPAGSLARAVCLPGHQHDPLALPAHGGWAGPRDPSAQGHQRAHDPRT